MQTGKSGGSLGKAPVPGSLWPAKAGKVQTCRRSQLGDTVVSLVPCASQPALCSWVSGLLGVKVPRPPSQSPSFAPKPGPAPFATSQPRAPACAQWLGSWLPGKGGRPRLHHPADRFPWSQNRVGFLSAAEVGGLAHGSPAVEEGEPTAPCLLSHKVPLHSGRERETALCWCWRVSVVKRLV